VHRTNVYASRGENYDSTVCIFTSNTLKFNERLGDSVGSSTHSRVSSKGTDQYATPTRQPCTT